MRLCSLCAQGSILGVVSEKGQCFGAILVKRNVAVFCCIHSQKKQGCVLLHS